MNLYKVLFNLVGNPLVPRFYRELRDYYIRMDKPNEAAAFDHLLEQKFGKKDIDQNDKNVYNQPGDKND